MDIFLQQLADGKGTSMLANIIFAVGIFFRVLGIIRVAKDSYARTSSPLKQFLYLLLATLLGPVVGVPLYIALRPPLYREELMGSASLSPTAQCLSCGMMNEDHHAYCVFCGDKMHIVCKECHQSYPASYAYCSYCGAPNMEE